MSKKLKIATISDLHGKHKEFEHNLRVNQWGYDVEKKYDESDILIFSGDCSIRGTKTEIKSFIDWFSDQPQPIKIMISGNHDFLFDYIHNDDKKDPKYPNINDIIPDNIIYLNDSGYEYSGVKIWGSPVQPAFHNWAFNKERGDEITKHWDLIPDDTDILIVHGPPKGILDRLSPLVQRRNEDPNVGCSDLLYAIENRINPKLVVFGHIHEGYGKRDVNDTTYINASCLNMKYMPTNKPFIIDLEF